MKKLIKLSAVCAAFVAAISATNVAQAQNLFNGPQEITQISTNTAGSLLVFLENMNAFPPCATNQSSYFLNAAGNAGATAMYAMILTAQASGQRVNISVDANNCSAAGFALITSARIVN